MKKNVIVLLVLASVAIFGALIFYKGIGKKDTPVIRSKSGQLPFQGTPTSGNSVNIQNLAFNPTSLTIRKGTTVIWLNNDSVPHQIKSTKFNSSKLNEGQRYSFTFNEVGTFEYSCAVHPSMVGKITVE